MAPVLATPTLEIQGLCVDYQTREATLPALSDVSFQVGAGEVVGIVGESGCGKSTLSSALMRLLPPNGRVTGGRIALNGQDLLAASEQEMRKLRGRELAMIFQDPLTSLNPTFTVGTHLVDVLRAHKPEGLDRRAMRRRAVEMLEQVGIPDASQRVDDYPHQFSGGMRQRIVIAMALMLEPSLLIADEPTSALDVTLELQILELLERLRREHGTAILFISHDLGVVARVCERVVVMYAGRTVEEGSVRDLYGSPLHPYTTALLGAVPTRRVRDERLDVIPGRVPTLSALPPGCKFADRCPHCRDVCRESEPRYIAVDDRRVRCAIYDPTSSYADATPARAAADIAS